MKQKMILLWLIGIITFSCEKDKNEIDKEIDQIVYVDINPDIVLQPVDSVGFHPSGLCQEAIPFPTDSVVDFEIDIDNDGENDFRFNYSTYYEWVSASSPCANYNSTVSISSLKSENKIAVIDVEMSEVYIFNFNDTINNNILYSDNAIIYRDAAMGFLYFGDFADDGYIGIKLSSGFLGWMKLNFQKDSFKCTILEYGYNENKNTDIQAGQIE